MSIFLWPEGLLSISIGAPMGTTGRLVWKMCEESTTVFVTDADPGLVKGWLRSERVKGVGRVMPIRPTRDLLENAMATGMHPELVIAADPEVIQEAADLGLPALFLADPAYRRPEWVPYKDRAPSAWHTLVADLENMQQAYAHDDRIQR